MDENLKLVPHFVMAKVDSGFLPETIVRLDNGLSISCSPWHPFLKMRGTARWRNPEKSTKHANGSRADTREQIASGHQWTRADELKIGERIAVGIHYPPGPHCGKSSNHLFLLGVLIGDGGLSDARSITLTIGQSELVTELEKILDDDPLKLMKRDAKYIYSIKRRSGAGKHWLLDWLRELGLMGKTGHYKFVPGFLFGASRDDIAAFLSGLFVTDGWVDRNYVGYCSVSEQLIDGVQALLLRLGIRAQKCKRTVKYKEGRTAYYLQIADATSVYSCAEWLRLLWKQTKLHQLVERNIAKRPRGRNRRFVQGQVEFVRISAITYSASPVQMYDLEIEGTHNFIANGIVAHNTSAGAGLAHYLSILFPENLGFIGRWEGKELRTSTIAAFLQLVPPEMIESHNSQMGIIKYKREYGGSTIIYSDLKETRYLKNMTLGWFWIDQAEEIDQARFDLLITRLRKHTTLYDQYDRAFGVAPNYGLLTFNPEGSDHFIYDYFHEKSPHRKPNYKLYMASTYESLAAKFVSQEYVDNMLDVFGANEAQKKRYMEGAWDIFEGRVYPAFDPEVHALDRFAIQPYHKCYETIDHGSTNPTAVGWWIWTEPCLGCGQPTRILVDEHYEGGGKGVAYHAAIIKTKRSQLPVKIALTYLDSQCWAMNQSKGVVTSSIHLEYVNEGIHPVMGPKTWDVAFSRITRALQSCPYARHPATGVLGAPHIFYLTHCRHFESEAVGYRWRKLAQSGRRNAPDEPQDFKDHQMDAWAYLESANPGGAVAPVKPHDESPLRRLEQLRKTWNPLADTPMRAGSWMGV